MSAANFAAIAGLRIAVVERSEHVGGTAAFTAGTTWVPGTHRAEEIGAVDTRAEALAFLDASIGSHSPTHPRACGRDSSTSAPKR
ncbi:FAD-binding protein [Brevibacterium marinum]|uniref:FAD-binding protein n=1 Tax=Brevibacterium marinum TaxID=418643 RepID=UPI003CD0A2A4